VGQNTVVVKLPDPNQVYKVLTQDDAPISFAAITADEAGTEGGAYLTPVQQSLIEDQSIEPAERHYTSRKNNSYSPPSEQHYTFRKNNSYIMHGLSAPDDNAAQSCSPADECVYTPDGPSDGPDEGESGNKEPLVKPARQRYEKFAKRTIVLSNIPDVTTHADIANIVRGGLVLEIYLRRDPQGRVACVSFLDAAHAYEFFQHVKRNDLHIRGKRVCRSQN
jgi:hypothetical protein